VVRPAAGLAAAVVAVLLLGGCGSDGSDDAQPTSTAAPTTGAGLPGPDDPTASGTSAPSTAATDTAGTGTSTASASTSASDDGGASTDSTGSVEGVWLATAGGAKVQLVLGKGKAGLTSTHLCGGGYSGTGVGGDNLRLTLTCMDGDKKRTKGTGQLSTDGRSLTVEWTGGPTDTFSRTGLPSS
jgi:hypothetical protein